MFKSKSTKIFAIVAGFLLIWVTFFDQSNIYQLIGLNREKSRLEDELRFYETEVSRLKVIRTSLLSDEEMLETFGRETYFMKKDDEDIFVVEP